MKYISLLIIGIFAIALSIPNLKGNISSIHWYNRLRVSKADTPKYGKAMGLGTLIIGVSIVVTAILQMIFEVESLFYITFVGVFIGFAIMLYAQFKYNRGIF